MAKHVHFLGRDCNANSFLLYSCAAHHSISFPLYQMTKQLFAQLIGEFWSAKYVILGAMQGLLLASAITRAVEQKGKLLLLITAGLILATFAVLLLTPA